MKVYYNVFMHTKNSNNPLTIVVFGATGDLYQNKLSVSLFNLFVQNLLPKDFNVVGFARRSFSDLEFQNLTKEAILNKNKICDRIVLENFLTHLRYVQGDLASLESFKNLSIELGKKDVPARNAESIASAGGENKVCSNKLFYLAVSPDLYRIILKNISEAGLTVPCATGTIGDPARNASSIADAGGENKWTRVLIEKPFGKDIEDAKKLDQMLGELFDESQIFRIDHYLAYLAKGVAEKIMKLKFSGFLGFSEFSGFGGESVESSWNKENIEKVRIVFHEKDLVGKRGEFFDSLGALRDVGQNHMLQMLALVAMENPSLEKVGGLHKARQNVLEKLKISKISEVSAENKENKIVRGQYQGYLDEIGVNPDSKTETFFRIVLFVENLDWQDTPFVLEFGKALDKSEVFIEICFKDSKTCIDFPVSDENTLRDAYDKVFYDCILGDQTIFVSTGEVMAQWKIITEIIQKWQDVPLIIYKKGSKAEDITDRG